MVDLHCQLPGLEGDPDAIWGRLVASAERQVIAGVELRVPGRDTVLLHVVLHAAQHANQVGGKPLEDLRRALALVEEANGRARLSLRARMGVFRRSRPVCGCCPRAGIWRAGSILVGCGRCGVRLRREDNVIAEELYALLSAEVGIGRKLAIAAGDIFPRPDYMRWWLPLARRGKRGLAFAYLWRAIWLVGEAPGALHTLWRVRRGKVRKSSHRGGRVRRRRRQWT